jgi:hypothetical protein
MNYHLYQNGWIGMANAKMSAENALILALLTNQKINFIHTGKIFNSEKRLSFFDLYDIDYDIVHNEYIQTQCVLPHDLHNTVVYKNQSPDEDFINGRSKIINLNDYNTFSTKDSNTLGFYSYMFCLDKHEKYDVEYFLRKTIKPKAIYEKEALRILKGLSSFNCIHTRRGDYLTVPNTKNNQIQAYDFLPILEHHFDNKLLLILSDEKDKSYFKLLDSKYQVRYIQDLVQGNYDSAEKGLIEMIVASYSNNFIGTLKSTFSAMIQRMRKQNGYNEDYKFLYSQDDNLVLENGKMIEREGKYPWNRVDLPQNLKDINFWTREWY